MSFQVDSEQPTSCKWIMKSKCMYVSDLTSPTQSETLSGWNLTVDVVTNTLEDDVTHQVAEHPTTQPANKTDTGELMAQRLLGRSGQKSID